jgi:class 3 adenylate cyclase
MTLLEDLKQKVDEYLAGDYTKVKKTSVPSPENIPLGNSAAELDATTLFIDVRQSSDITNAFRRQTAAKMMKGYFDGSVRIINKNGGSVRSFNGGGMLALFMGDSRSDNAVKAAMQTKWFVEEVSRSRFKSYFSSNQTAIGNALDFSIGAGLDEGTIFAVRVGIKGTNDVAWVGRCTNTSAKLANLTSSPQSIAITRAVYERLNQNRKYSKQTHMWSAETMREIGGVTRGVRTTSYRWSIK